MRSKLYRDEKSFLSGPRSRINELIYTIGILRQFIKGFRTLHFIGPGITIFGSARFSEDHEFYQLARKIASILAEKGFTIVTGGGPGIMEAANRGAKDVGGLSVGCNIVLPNEQHANPFLDVTVDIDYFFVRKELLRKYSMAFIVMPGGLGTMDEFFETVTLIQTKMSQNFPVVVIGLNYYQHLIKHFNLMVKENTIASQDMELVLFTDELDEALRHIDKYTKSRVVTDYKPIWFLGERKIKKNKKIL